MEPYSIKSVAFGGFDRQDVVRYLEQSARIAAEEKQSLLQEAEQLRQELEERERERDDLRAQLDAASAREEELREELRQETARREELESLRSLEAENARLRSEAAALQRDADAYARFRERLGSIECEARERADALEANAAEKIRSKMAQFQDQYQALIHIIESTAGHVTGELRKVEVNLSQLPRAMDQAEKDFENLTELVPSALASERPAPSPSPGKESTGKGSPEKG